MATDCFFWHFNMGTYKPVSSSTLFGHPDGFEVILKAEVYQPLQKCLYFSCFYVTVTLMHTDDSHHLAKS